MPNYKGSNRTAKGLELEKKHQQRYEKWLLGKTSTSTELVNGLPVAGKIIKVEYIGNSVYGIVRLDIETGAYTLIGSMEGHRPTKADFHFVEDL
jgi:hypothetical protein